MEHCPICPINEILQNEPKWGQMQNSGAKVGPNEPKMKRKKGLNNGITKFIVMGDE